MIGVREGLFDRGAVPNGWFWSSSIITYLEVFLVLFCSLHVSLPLNDLIPIMRASLFNHGLLRSTSPLAKLFGDFSPAAQVGCSCASCWNSFHRKCKLSRQPPGCFGINCKRIPINVVEGIASQMIAWVFGGTSTSKKTR